MNARRRFLRTASVLAAGSALAAGSRGRGGREWRDYDFRPYRRGETLGPTHIVTPPGGYFVNTYYDVDPWSPSGRYLALTELPYQDAVTVLGDRAWVVVVDLARRRYRRVAATRMWGYQMGAILHWGAGDDELFAHDVAPDGRGVGVRIDLRRDRVTPLAGPLYDVDPAGRTGIGPNLERLNHTQYAYGTPTVRADPSAFPALAPGADPEEGVWETDLDTGARRLLIPLPALAEAGGAHARLRGCGYTVFHVKYSPDKRHILVVLRCSRPRGEGPSPRNPQLLVARRDGTALREVLSLERWSRGGHHPTWRPDGEGIVMNLTDPRGDETLRFCSLDRRGAGFAVLSDAFVGSGHPSLDPTGRWLLADAYPSEPMANAAGEVPIRLLDLAAGREHCVARVFTDVGRALPGSRFWGPPKLDAHPAWNATYDRVCFNGAPTGERAVLLTDLSDFFDA